KMPSPLYEKCGMKSYPSRRRPKPVQNDFTSYMNTSKKWRCKMTKEPNVGITNYHSTLKLSDYDIVLSEQSPLPELTSDLPALITDESKLLMTAAKDLEARLEKLCKA